jgi:hypothetical protein
MGLWGLEWFVRDLIGLLGIGLVCWGLDWFVGEWIGLLGLDWFVRDLIGLLGIGLVCWGLDWFVGVWIGLLGTGLVCWDWIGLLGTGLICWGLDWFVEGQGLCCAVLNTVLNFMIPLKAGNFLTSQGTDSFLRISLLDGVVSTELFKKITVNKNLDLCVVIIGL